MKTSVSVDKTVIYFLPAFVPCIASGMIFMSASSVFKCNSEIWLDFDMLNLHGRIILSGPKKWLATTSIVDGTQLLSLVSLCIKDSSLVLFAIDGQNLPISSGRGVCLVISWSSMADFLSLLCLSESFKDFSMYESNIKSILEEALVANAECL